MTTGVVSPYTQWFRKQQKLLKDIAVGTIYSPEQAKTEFGLDVGEGWQVKVEDYEPVEHMASFTYINPEGWQIKPDDILVSPGGESFTRQELETRRAEALVPPPVTPTITPAVEPAFEGLTKDYQLLYREYQRTGGVLDIPSWTRAGAPIRPIREIDEEFLRGLYTRESVEGAEALLRVLVQGAIHEDGTPYTPEEIEQTITETTSFFVTEEEREAQLIPLIQAVFPDYDLDDFEFMIREHPDEFISRIQEGGRTPEKVALLTKVLGIPLTSDSEADVGDFFPEGIVPTAPIFEDWVATQGFDKTQYANILRERGASEADIPSMVQTTWDELKATYEYEHDLGRWAKAKGWWEKAVISEPGRLIDAALVLGEGLKLLPEQLRVSIMTASLGKKGALISDEDEEIVNKAQANMDEFVKEITEKFPDSQFLIELASTSQNLAFSITSMGAGLAVGAPISFIPLPYARVAAYTTGTAASGAVAYNMTTYQIMKQYLDLRDGMMLTEQGRHLTDDERLKLYNEFDDLAHQYGLWEAIPEAISNLAFVSIFTAPMALIAKKLGISGLTRIIVKVASLYGEELLTETITQKGQAAIEVEAGLREGTITWWEALKEIAPQTFILTTIMAGAGQTIISSTNAIKKVRASLKAEIGEGNLYNELAKHIEENLPQAVETKSPIVEVPEATIEPTAEVAPEVIPAEVPAVPEVKPEYKTRIWNVKGEAVDVPVQGRPVALAGVEELNFFVHKEAYLSAGEVKFYNRYHISEVSTGLRLTPEASRTQKEAIAKAGETVNKRGIEAVRKAVSDAEKITAEVVEAKPSAVEVAKPPVIEGLQAEYTALVNQAGEIAPSNMAVIKAKEIISNITPENQRESLIQIEALEDELKGIVAPEVAPETAKLAEQLKAKLAAEEPIIPPDEPVSTTMIPNTQGMGGVGALEKYVRMPRKTFIKLGQWRNFFKPTQEAEVLLHEEQKAKTKMFDQWDKWIGKNQERKSAVTKAIETGDTRGLTFDEKRMVAQFNKWATEWADRKGIPIPKRIKNYMTHLFDNEANRQIKEEGGIDPVLAKILSEKATKKITDPFLKKRLGAVGWIEDPVASARAYEAVSLKFAYYTPLLNKIDAILADPDIPQAEKNYWSEYSRRLTGEWSEFDKAANVHNRDFAEFIKDTPVIGKWLYPRLTQGNPAGAATYHLTGTLYLMYLGFKATSAIRNLSQHLLILGEVGPKHFVKGIALRVDKTAMAARNKGLVYRSRKFAYTAGIDATFVNRSADVVRETGMYMFRRIDKTNVTTGFLAGYSEAQEFLVEANNRVPVEKRWSQERLEQAFIDRGDEVDADTQYLYTKLNSMPIAQSAIGRPASMLVTWTNNWIELMIKWAKRSESQVYAEFERETGTKLKGKNWSHTYKAMLLYATIVGLAFALDDKTPIKLKEYTGIGSIRYLAGTVSGELPFLEAYGATAKVVGGFVTDDERMLNEGLYELRSSFTPGIIKQLDDVSAGDKDWTNLLLYTEGKHFKILQLKEDWGKGWIEYVDFGDAAKRHEYALENKDYRALSESQMRDKWREENWKEEAQMFIVGQFTTLSSDEARAEVLRLIEKHKIDPDLVDGYAKIFGADIKSELQGFQDRIGNLEKLKIGEDAEYFKTSNYLSELNRLVKKHGMVAVADSASPLTEFILGEQTTWEWYDDFTEEGGRLARQQNPELEASLYLFGKIRSFQNPLSAKILLQLMAQYGIPPESIQAFIDNPEKYDNLFSPRLKLEQDTYELTTLSKNYGNSEAEGIYIEDEEARNKARAKLREDNPDWVADLRRIEAMDNDATPEIMEGWVYRGTVSDEFGGSSREVKVWMLDNKDVHKWALDNELLTDDGKDWNEPLLRLQVDWAIEEEEYNALETTSDRREYLFPNNEATDYCLAHYEIQSYEEDIPEGYRQEYITWFTDLSIKEKPEDYPSGIPYWEDNWWMLEHRGFHDKVWMGILDNQSYPIEIRTKEGVQYLIDAEGKPSKTPPTRELGAKYLEYIRISRGEIEYTDPKTGLVYESKGQGADQYRIDNPDMDEWGVAVGIWATTMTEKRKQLGETPGEKAEREAQELIDWFKEEQERLREEALR